jgi:hypothetical protein
VVLAASLIAIAISTAQAEGEFPSPDGRSTVRVSRIGEVVLTVGTVTHELGRMPWGPRHPDIPDVPIGGRFEHAVWSPDSRRVAIVGRCNGYSGVTVPAVPRCASDFVRVVSIDDPSRARSLALPWSPVADRTEVQAVAFERGGDRVGAIVRIDWSDCSYGGTEIRLYSWNRGSVEVNVLLADRHPHTPRELEFERSSIRVTSGTGARKRRRNVPLAAR